MGKVRARKTNRGDISKDVFLQACQTIVDTKTSIRSVAKSLNICHVTLRRYYLKFKNGESINPGYHPHNKVFTDDHELLLAKYCQDSAKLYYGVTTLELRKLAYEFAEANNLKYPNQWKDNKMAGVDWQKTFIKKHPELSIRTPEATSLSRAMNFNRPNVEKFYNNLARVNERYHFEAQNIWNLDETPVTTTQKPTKIIASKGIKQVGSITSQERGTLVTMCLAISAIGNSIPPFFVFPRVNFQEHFVESGPPGSSGSANKSGWMQEKDFLLFMKHFVKHVKPTENNRVLLVLDNHSSHVSISVINYCRANFITLLSFPPHTSHKLQPLDRSIFGPFKHRYNVEADHWCKNHPGQRMTIYNIPGLVAKALPLAVIPVNIKAGFECTGIFPYNPNIFSDDEFAPSIVTDMPQNPPSVELSLDQPKNVENKKTDSQRLDQQASLDDLVNQKVNDQLLSIAQCNNNSPGPNISEKKIVYTPEVLRPLPKAVLKSFNKKSRSRGKTAIYTDTPEKLALEKEQEKKKKPKRLNLDKTLNKNKISNNKNTCTKRKVSKNNRSTKENEKSKVSKTKEITPKLK